MTDAAYPTACKWCGAELIDESPSWITFACNSGFFRKRAGEDAAWERDEKCWSADIAALHARIAELEAALDHCASQAGPESCADVLKKYATLCEGLKALAAKLEQIVCVTEPDRGVIYLSNDSPTHYDAEQGCQVYDHEHFSPLGDALIELHKSLTALLGEKEPHDDAP